MFTGDLKFETWWRYKTLMLGDSPRSINRQIHIYFLWPLEFHLVMPFTWVTIYIYLVAPLPWMMGS